MEGPEKPLSTVLLHSAMDTWCSTWAQANRLLMVWCFQARCWSDVVQTGQVPLWSHLNRALFQKLWRTPACLLSAALLPPLWLMRLSVSAKAAAALLSISGSDK